MGGASISFFRGPLSGAINPASLLHVDPSFEVALMGFLPQRGATLDTSGLLVGEEVEVESENPFFLAPNFAISWRLSSKIALGLSFYSSGGMNTEYRTNLYHKSFSQPISLFSAAAAGVQGAEPNGREHQTVKAALLNAPHTGTLGVNLEQGVFTPTLSYRWSEELSLGASLLIGAQRFSAQGLGDFVSFSNSPLALTDNGGDISLGLGARLGLSYNPQPWVRLGVVASSKVYMSAFENYQGLFAGEGNFDIPAHFGLGVALSPLPNLHLSADVTHIMYEGVESLSNPGPTADQLLTGFNQALNNGFKAQLQGIAVPVNEGAISPLGTEEGYGFGWESVWVGKLGLAYDVTPHFTAMLGYAYGQNPVGPEDVLFNLIAPAVVQHHITGGLSAVISPRRTLTFSYQYVPYAEVKGDYQASEEAATQLAGGPIPLSLKGSAWMSQQVAELSYRQSF